MGWERKRGKLVQFNEYLLGKDDESPIHIEAETGLQDRDAVLPWRRISLRYADGCEIILDGENRDKNAPFIEGPLGKVYKGFVSTLPNLAEKLRSFPEPEDQVTDFGLAVRTRRKFALNEENGHRSCTLINLGKIALRLGRGVRFDPDKQIFIGDEAADRLDRQPLRAPWHF